MKLSKNSLFIIVGIVLIAIFLPLYLLSPLYLPYYKVIDKTLINNYKVVSIPSHKDLKVLSFSTNNINNTIYIIVENTSSTLYVQIFNTTLIGNNSMYIIEKVYPGNYSIAIENPNNYTVTAVIHFGLFPYSEINTFFTVSGIISTVSEVFITLGIVAMGYGILSSIFKRRK